MPKTLMGLLLAVACCASALASPPAVVYDAVQYDDAFNVAANEGIERYKREFGIARQAFGARNIRRFAEIGADPVIAIGFGLADEVKAVAKEFPDVHFTIVDAVVTAPNVQSVIFKDHEGAYLVGMLAGLSSKTGRLGFVGGMDIPVIRNFLCGYEQGVLRSRPSGKVISVMTGNTPEAFNDPQKGSALARSLFEKDVDVVFAAAGATGLGVYQAAKETRRLAIGVDRNQNFLHPGTMLSSMLKRIDVAVYLASRGPRDGNWSGGSILRLGLKEQGVGWALDKFNRPLVSAEMQQKVEAAQAEIVSGTLQVPDYRPDGGCKVRP